MFHHSYCSLSQNVFYYRGRTGYQNPRHWCSRNLKLIDRSNCFIQNRNLAAVILKTPDEIEYYQQALESNPRDNRNIVNKKQIIQKLDQDLETQYLTQQENIESNPAETISETNKPPVIKNAPAQHSIQTITRINPEFQQASSLNVFEENPCLNYKCSHVCYVDRFGRPMCACPKGYDLPKNEVFNCVENWLAKIENTAETYQQISSEREPVLPCRNASRSKLSSMNVCVKFGCSHSCDVENSASDVLICTCPFKYILRGGWVKTKLSKKKLPRLFTASKTGYLDRKRLFR